MSGMLYLCATPIGNLEDITLRTIRVLKEVDLIAAEDTRDSKKLLNHYGIQTPLTSYHEHNKWDKGRTIIKKLLQGNDVALITDAGMPGISDPGEELVKMAYSEGIAVTVLPGATAFLTALILSGLASASFLFEGFLPVENKERREKLEALKSQERTIILYEAPHRLKKTLSDLVKMFGGSRTAALARELTKIHENVDRASLSQLAAMYNDKEPKGEYVIVVAGFNAKAALEAEQKKWAELSLKEHYELYVSSGIDRAQALKQVAKDRGLSKRDIYNEFVKNAKS